MHVCCSYIFKLPILEVLPVLSLFFFFHFKLKKQEVLLFLSFLQMVKWRYLGLKLPAKISQPVGSSLMLPLRLPGSDLGLHVSPCCPLTLTYFWHLFDPFHPGPKGSFIIISLQSLVSLPQHPKVWRHLWVWLSLFFPYIFKPRALIFVVKTALH